MRLGGYTGIVLILFSSYASANPAVLTMGRLIGTFVAERAIGTEIATATATSASRLPALIEAGSARLASMSPLVSKTGNALNWIGLGYGLNALQNELFEGPKQYSANVPGTSKTVYGSSPESLLTQMFEYMKTNNPKQLSCYTDAPCKFSGLTDIKTEPAPYPGYPYTLISGTYTAVADNGYYRADNKYMIPVQLSSSSPFENKKGVISLADDADFNDLKSQLDEMKLDNKTVVKLINELMLKNASQSDYKGIPFNTSNLLTVNELESILNKHFNNQAITMGHLIASTVNQNTNKQEVIILPTESTHTSDKTVEKNDIDLSHPDNSPPDLKSPTAEQIISPLNNFFPFLKNFEIPEKQAQCPTAEFDVFEQHYIIDSHCGLFEKISGLLKLFSLIVWSFLGLRIVLSS